MTSVAQTRDALSGIAAELDQLSSTLAEIERKLEPVQEEYDKFLRDFEIGLWQKHIDEDAKFPSERMREHLAHKAMPPEVYGRYFALVNSRKRAEARIKSLGKAADAQRSVLSALKVELEATA